MRRMLCVILLFGAAGVVGCGGSSTPKPLTDADVQAQQEQERKVKDDESAYRQRQPQPKTRQEAVDEGERRLRR